MSGGASWLHMCIRHRETESYLSSAAGLDNLISRGHGFRKTPGRGCAFTGRGDGSAQSHAPEG